MTATIEKIAIKPTWNVEKIQQHNADTFARVNMTIFTVLGKMGPDAITQYQHASTMAKAEFYKSEGVKTPIDLVRHMAEFETNVLGSKIKVWGDEKEAHLEYEVCACFNAMQKLGSKAPMKPEEMGKMFAACTESLGKEFGFVGTINLGKNPGEPCAVVSFTRK